MTPGSSDRRSTAESDLMKNISVQASGNTIPQLMLGGLR